MKTAVRLGVIGYGRRIHGLIQGPFREVEPDLRLVGVVDPDEQGARARIDGLGPHTAEGVRFYDDVAALLREARPDAIAIGTRCNLHTPYAVELANAGVPLFLEKPVAISLEQALALERAYENAAAPVVVSFPLRVSPLCELACGYLADGAVGEPLHVSAVNYVPYGTVYWEQPYRDYDITGGLVGRDRWDDGTLRPGCLTRVAGPCYGRTVKSCNAPVGPRGFAEPTTAIPRHLSSTSAKGLNGKTRHR